MVIDEFIEKVYSFLLFEDVFRVDLAIVGEQAHFLPDHRGVAMPSLE